MPSGAAEQMPTGVFIANKRKHRQRAGATPTGVSNANGREQRQPGESNANGREQRQLGESNANRRGQCHQARAMPLGAAGQMPTGAFIANKREQRQRA